MTDLLLQLLAGGVTFVLLVAIPLAMGADA